VAQRDNATEPYVHRRSDARVHVAAGGVAGVLGGAAWPKAKTHRVDPKFVS
jgi:hypothetical protein